MSQEFEYYSVMNTTEYAGKWVAIVGDKVIASGDNLREVHKKAKEIAGKKEPLFAKIPNEEETLIL
ncbi:hypothetical protein BH23THE1_BH23THE1_12480 [soil metagenome]